MKKHKIDPNKIGDLAEYRAMLWLLERGYEVYKNVNCTGKIDMIAKKDGEIIFIDVKTLSKGILEYQVKDKESTCKINGTTILWVYGERVGWDYKKLANVN